MSLGKNIIIIATITITLVMIFIFWSRFKALTKSDNMSQIAGSEFKIESSSTAYYIDSVLGSDSNDGKSKLNISSSTGPWKTLSRIANKSFVAGDSILLNCEGIWRERLELKNAFASSGKVRISGYGNCDNSYPRITGADLIRSPWVVDSNNPNLMVTNLDKEPVLLFINGKKYTAARYPNYISPLNSYNLTKSINSNSSVVLSDIDKTFLADKDITGAKFYMRVEPWWMHATTIKSYDTSSATLIPTLELPFTAELGDGYILEGKKWMIDTEGEWYYDTAEKKLYVWREQGVDLNNMSVEASIRHNSIYLNGASNIELSHIKMGETVDKSLATLNSNNVNINDITVTNDYSRNVEIINSENVSISNATLSGAGYIGIDMRGGNNNSITNIKVKGHGLGSYPGAVQAAIAVNSDNVLVENNTVEDAGYHGISFGNKNGTRILNNTIKNICIKFSDCGGIYTYNGDKLYNPTSGTVVQGNSIENGEINSHGSHVSLTAGVYLDNFTNNVLVKNNFISNVQRGIFLHEASDNKILNNKTWKTAAYALGGSASSGDQYRNTISGNAFFAAKYNNESKSGGNADIESMASAWSNALSLSEILNSQTIINNRVVTFNSTNEPLFKYNNTSFNLTDWNVSGRSDVIVNPFESSKLKVATSGPNVILNGNMSGQLWGAYFENKNQGERSTTTSPLCDELCTRLKSGAGGDILISNKFNLNSNRGDNLYLISVDFSAGSADTTGHVTIRRDGSPYDSFGYSKPLPIIKANTKYTLTDIFVATSSERAMLNIYGKVGTEIFVDNVSLYKVNNIKYFDPYAYSSHLINNTDLNKSFTCAEARIESCVAVDDDGNNINWPLILTPRSSKIIMSDTSSWRVNSVNLLPAPTSTTPGVTPPVAIPPSSPPSPTTTQAQQEITNITPTPIKNEFNVKEQANITALKVNLEDKPYSVVNNLKPNKSFLVEKSILINKTSNKSVSLYNLESITAQSQIKIKTESTNEGINLFSKIFNYFENI
jgi:parallel beta-helix repeat protein